MSPWGCPVLIYGSLLSRRNTGTSWTLSQFVGKGFLRRSIVLTRIRNCWAYTADVTLACNIPIAISRSTGVNLGIVNKQFVTFNSKVLKRDHALKIRPTCKISVVCTYVNLNWTIVHVKKWKMKNRLFH